MSASCRVRAAARVTQFIKAKSDALAIAPRRNPRERWLRRHNLFCAGAQSRIGQIMPSLLFNRLYARIGGAQS